LLPSPREGREIDGTTCGGDPDLLLAEHCWSKFACAVGKQSW